MQGKYKWKRKGEEEMAADVDGGKVEAGARGGTCHPSSIQCYSNHSVPAIHSF